MQLQLKTLLNHVHAFKGFVYDDVRLARPEGRSTRHITAKMVPHKASKPLCGSCEQPRACYDHPRERSFMFVPLWGMMVYLLYRWCLLKSVKNLTKKQHGCLKGLLRLNLRTVRAYLLKEDFTGCATFLDRAINLHPGWICTLAD
jgi:transposase